MATTYEEVWDLMRALIASQQETDFRFQETERLLKQQSQDTDRKFQETDRKIKEVSSQIGKLGNRLGDFVEEMVRPALVRLFQKRELDIHRVAGSIIAYDEKNRIRSEVDLITSNNTVAVVVECKSQLSIDDVNDHIKRLELFKENFPEYAQKRILGAVAAMVMPANVAKYAINKGLYLLVQSGEAVIIDNDASFVPKQW